MAKKRLRIWSIVNRRSTIEIKMGSKDRITPNTNENARDFFDSAIGNFASNIVQEHMRQGHLAVTFAEGILGKKSERVPFVVMSAMEDASKRGWVIVVVDENLSSRPDFQFVLREGFEMIDRELRELDAEGVSIELPTPEKISQLLEMSGATFKDSL